MRCLVAASVATSDCTSVAEKRRLRATWSNESSTTSSGRSMLVGLVRRNCCAHAPVGRTANMTDRLGAQKKLSSLGRQHRQLKDKPQKSEWLASIRAASLGE